MQNRNLLSEEELREEWNSSLQKLELVSSIDQLKNFEKTYLTTKSSVIPLLIQRLTEFSLEERRNYGKLINK